MKGKEKIRTRAILTALLTVFAGSGALHAETLEELEAQQKKIEAKIKAEKEKAAKSQLAAEKEKLTALFGRFPKSPEDAAKLLSTKSKVMVIANGQSRSTKSFAVLKKISGDKHLYLGKVEISTFFKDPEGEVVELVRGVAEMKANPKKLPVPFVIHDPAAFYAQAGSKSKFNINPERGSLFADGKEFRPQGDIGSVTVGVSGPGNFSLSLNYRDGTDENYAVVDGRIDEIK